MSSTPEPPAGVDYVFGYGSLVELRDPVSIEGRLCPPVAGRLRDFHRRWGAAMNNWEAGPLEKHFIDPETGEQPRIRVAYLDVEERSGDTVNGLAIPVDARRLAELDEREVNYLRIDVSAAFEPQLSRRVFTYLATEEARERCRRRDGEAEVFASRDYVAAVRRAFGDLGEGQLEEYDRTTEPLAFPERHLELIYPPPKTGSPT
jgi:cation transport regulator ChaC